MKEIHHRNYAQDLLKCIAALMVVFNHYCKIQGEYGILFSEIIRAITWSAVPLFFMITGYYLPVIVENKKQQRQIKKVFKLALVSTTFYLVYRLIDASITSSATEWLTTHYTVGTLFSWIVLCDDPTGYHLWYLYSLLYSLLFYAGLYRFKLQRYIPLLTLFAILLLFTINYTGLFLSRNFIVGIPCIGLGIMVREGIIKINNRKILFPIVIILSITEILFFYNYLFTSIDVYTFSIFVALCMLTWAINNPSKGQGTVWTYIGMKLSAYIYIFHVFVDNMIGLIMDYNTFELQIVRPFVVFAASTLFSYLYVKCKEMMFVFTNTSSAV